MENFHYLEEGVEVEVEEIMEVVEVTMEEVEVIMGEIEKEITHLDSL